MILEIAAPMMVSNAMTVSGVVLQKQDVKEAVAVLGFLNQTHQIAAFRSGVPVPTISMAAVHLLCVREIANGTNNASLSHLSLHPTLRPPSHLSLHPILHKPL